jgi:pimeloyl-ACP methyl ester carboxylesterase/DNA-binding winged helix-turn-helix (wHTH) protein
MHKVGSHAYYFGHYCLEPAERLLTCDTQVVSVAPKALDVLIALVERSRSIVSKEELISLIWPDLRVDEASLSHHISALRKILGEHEAQAGGRYIETVPKHGYRFVAPVKRRKAASRDARVSVRATLTAQPAAERATGDVRSSSDANTKDSAAAFDTTALPMRRGKVFLPGIRPDRYQFLSVLGAGGMGEVYLARDLRLDRKVALKVLSEKYTDNSEWLRRFVREAKAASALNHPNILTIHEVGEVDGIHYIATEHIEGKTLRAQMLGRQLELSAALEIILQVASALCAAHAAGIVHRDIKPENIMVRPDGYVKLLDFGLAKPMTTELSSPLSLALGAITSPGIVMGTLVYMSPEQTRGGRLDARSDIFSLGVVLYELLTGKAPFAAKTTSDLIVAILTCAPAPLSSIVSTTPPELERIIDRALHKEVSQRYQTMLDFQQDLKALQKDLQLRQHLGAARSAQLPAAMRTDDTLVLAPAPVAQVSLSGMLFSSGAGYLPPPAPSVPVAPALVPAAGSFAHAYESSEAQLEIPQTHYARSGEINIAYQVIGDAPLDLVFVMGWISHLEYFWTEPTFARFLRRLASFCRVILFDKRGTGLSDRVPVDQLPTLEQRMDDVRAVMEAVGSERAVLCGVSEGGPMCALFAATYPERTIALVMMGSYARRLRGEAYPWGPTEAQRDLFLEEIRNHWGGPVGLEDRAPSVAADPEFRSWWASYLRRGASPGAAVALTRMNTEIDIRHVLPTVRVPTLIVHRTGDLCLKIEEGRYLAENIPGAKFVELAGIDHLPFVGAQDEILDEIEEFLTGVRHASDFDRVLATVLHVCVDAAMPPGAGSDDLRARLQSFFRKEVQLFKGRVVETSDSEMLATFDGPARAIRAACAIRAAAQRLNIRVSTGLHTGECDVIGDGLGGAAVEIAKQVAAKSNTGEVLVSSTVKDLVAGSGIQFAERDSHTLSGGLGDWRLFAVLRSG